MIDQQRISEAALQEIDGIPDWAVDLPRLDLERYLALPGMTGDLRRLVEQLMYRKQSAPPSNSGSWRGRYPSLKMRRVIHWGSRNYELPMVVALERRHDCIAYFTQPRMLKISAAQPDGPATYRHKPDALALFLGDDDGRPYIKSKWIEAKSESDLRKEPDKFVRDAKGRWAHPAAAEVVMTTYGSEYEIWNPSNLDPTVISNWMFLGPYLDKILDVPASLRQQVILTLRRYPATDLNTLRERVEGLSADHGYALIADGAVAFPIDHQDLAHPERLTLFADPVFAEAAMAMPMRDLPGTRRELVLTEGVRLRWGQKDYHVVNVNGEQVICLLDGKILPPLNRTELVKLAERGDIEQLDAAKDSLAAVLADLGTTAEQDNTRDRVVRAYRIEAEGPKTRHDWRILAKVQEAKKLDLPVARLLKSEVSKRGWWGKRLRDATDELRKLNEGFITAAVAQYVSATAPKARAVHREYAEAAKKAGCLPIALSTFQDYLADQPQEQVTEVREGRRAALAAAPNQSYKSVYAIKAPRAQGKIHLDHTRIALKAVALRGGRRIPIGYPWCTLQVDSYSTKVFRPVLVFDAPSAATLQLAVRSFVAETGRFPEGYASDNGPEFGSNFWDLVTRSWRVWVLQRPVINPRHGSDVELKFGSLDNFLFDHLLGSSTPLRDLRKVSSSHLPDNTAVSTIADAFDYICGWADAHNNTPIRGIELTPNELYEQSLREHGTLPHLRVAMDDRFYAMTMAREEHVTVKRGSVAVKRVTYACAALQALRDGTPVSVRWDPYDRSRAAVFIAGAWFDLEVQERYADLRNLSEKERRFRSLEITELIGREPDFLELTAHLEKVKGHQSERAEEIRMAEQKALLAGTEAPEATEDDIELVPLESVDEEVRVW